MLQDLVGGYNLEISAAQNLSKAQLWKAIYMENCLKDMQSIHSLDTQFYSWIKPNQERAAAWNTFVLVLQRIAFTDLLLALCHWLTFWWTFKEKPVQLFANKVENLHFLKIYKLSKLTQAQLGKPGQTNDCGRNWKILPKIYSPPELSPYFGGQIPTEFT